MGSQELVQTWRHKAVLARLTMHTLHAYSTSGVAASKAAAADASAAAALKLDPADDPIWRDIEEYSKELELPATPPTE